MCLFTVNVKNKVFIIAKFVKNKNPCILTDKPVRVIVIIRDMSIFARVHDNNAIFSVSCLIYMSGRGQYV